MELIESIHLAGQLDASRFKYRYNTNPVLEYISDNTEQKILQQFNIKFIMYVIRHDMEIEWIL